MKTLIIITAALAATGGCRSPRSSSGNPALKSERQYATDSEARAQDLYRTGQASSIAEARAQAVGEANAAWAAATKAAENRKKQEKLEKDFAKTNRDGM